MVHLAAGGSQVNDASGGPAGGQTFEKFDKQALAFFTEAFANDVNPKNEG